MRSQYEDVKRGHEELRSHLEVFDQKVALSEDKMSAQINEAIQKANKDFGNKAIEVKEEEIGSVTEIVETGMVRQDERMNETMKGYEVNVESTCASLQNQIDSVNRKLENHDKLFGGIQMQVKTFQSNEVAQESTYSGVGKCSSKERCDSRCCSGNAKPRPPDMSKMMRKLPYISSSKYDESDNDNYCVPGRELKRSPSSRDGSGYSNESQGRERRHQPGGTNYHYPAGDSGNVNLNELEEAERIEQKAQGNTRAVRFISPN